jgi:hypothetical protein
MKRAVLSRVLLICGIGGMVAGAVDPLEGSVIIVPAAGLVALAALAAKDRARMYLCLAFVLLAAGVGAVFVLSAFGGFGGNTGRSNWWWLAIAPYPIGWATGLTGAILMLRRMLTSRTETPRLENSASHNTESTSLQ